MKLSLLKKLLILITIISICSFIAAIAVNYAVTKNTYDTVLKEEMGFLAKYYEKEFNSNIENNVKSLEHYNKQQRVQCIYI